MPGSFLGCCPLQGLSHRCGRFLSSRRGRCSRSRCCGMRKGARLSCRPRHRLESPIGTTHLRAFGQATTGGAQRRGGPLSRPRRPLPRPRSRSASDLILCGERRSDDQLVSGCHVTDCAKAPGRWPRTSARLSGWFLMGPKNDTNLKQRLDDIV